jgi:hypothetical protein
VNVFGNTETPTPPQPEPQTGATVDTPTSPPVKPPSSEVTQVRGLALLKSMSKNDKDTIINEPKRGIENPYYKLMGNGALAYKDAQMRKHKKIANAFGEPKEYIDFDDTDTDLDVPDPIVKEAVVEQKVKPPPFKKSV